MNCGRRSSSSLTCGRGAERGPLGHAGSNYVRQPLRRHTLDTVARTSFVEFFELTGLGGRLWAVGVLPSGSRTTPQFVSEYLRADGWSVTRSAARSGSLLIELADDAHVSVQWSTDSDVVEEVLRRFRRLGEKARSAVRNVPPRPGGALVLTTFGDLNKGHAINSMIDLLPVLDGLGETMFLQNGSPLVGELSANSSRWVREVTPPRRTSGRWRVATG